MKIKVLLVDDHAIVLKGLKFFLQTQRDIEVVGEARNGKEAIAKVEKYQPDVVLMDLIMPEMDGIEATRKIKETYPQVKVIVLTSFSDQEYVLSGIKAGAEGYQLKDVEPDILVEAIKKTVSGEKALHSQVTHQLVTHVTSQEESAVKFSSLTPREKDVLYHITLGKSNKEIAADLNVTEKTVKTHVTRILAKLELHDRTQTAVYAIKHKWFGHQQ
ncbi:DNA-binding NarL/FixJ family response regulator [Caldalkalibacillus uzonensis]|uniref:DNA-binding NarL/FixJ family response regulator n=1 Tax=Caldalkalibacillus uzonensis TaxID=353224 RepID=A0ABU0CM24_9BACI|nr:response regulator transcription factor [Caldalkalibacillus uzonensis]MDQ0337460.1 DNA-binding NarL/FixJ family response regulator [Caldalkalibacillus uzonensis]